MVRQAGWFTTQQSDDKLVIAAGGDWDINSLADLDKKLQTVPVSEARSVQVDLSAIDGLDTGGAWILCRTRDQLRSSGIAVEFQGAKPAHAELLERVEMSHVAQQLELGIPHPLIALIERMGRAAHEALGEGINLISFLGVTALTAGRAILSPRRIRLTSLVHHIERVGLDAMPIVGLLAFLIGVVVAYQGADQLSRFGAAVFTVNLLGVSILREMGVLLTAIIIAGRSGSAFTAQIGTMQVNEEVHAMRTIGLDPIEMLVLPRVFALFIALPLLTVYADLMGLIGGALMLFATLDISLVQFVERFNVAVPLNSFWVGLIKAPIFGFVIGMVGCSEGLKVAGSAESVGRQTTKSVAVSIFLVIVLDALFSIFFSYIRM